MFKIAVNNLVQSIGDDVYLPSPSTAASKNLSPLSLVERKAGILPVNRLNHYYTTDFTLEDVVENGDFKMDVEPDDPFVTFDRESTVKVEGMLKGHIKGIFDAGVRSIDSVKIKTELGQLSISEVDIQSLITALSNRKLNMHHELVRQLSAAKRRALCVVPGVVKTVGPATISATLNHAFSAEAEGDKPSTLMPGKVVGGQTKGAHEKDSVRTLHLPAGTALAFQVAELAVGKDGNFRLMVAHNSKGGFKANLHLDD